MNEKGECLALSLSSTIDGTANVIKEEIERVIKEDEEAPEKIIAFVGDSEAAQSRATKLLIDSIKEQFPERTPQKGNDIA